MASTSTSKPAIAWQVGATDAETRRALVEAHARLQERFVAWLWAATGTAALAHLRTERGLSDDLIREMGIGFWPEGRDVMPALCAQLGIPPELAVIGGLLKPRTKWWVDRLGAQGTLPKARATWAANQSAAAAAAGYRDFPCIVQQSETNLTVLLGQWLTLPMYITTAQQQTAIGGFVARSLRPKSEIGKESRYKNPINTPLLTWREHLIGTAEEDGRLANTLTAVVCEGPFDRAAVLEATRALPVEQRPAVYALGGIELRAGKEASPLAKIRAMDVILALDADQPGMDAVVPITQQLAARGIRVRVARVEEMAPQAKDVGEALVAPAVPDVSAASRILRELQQAVSPLEAEAQRGVLASAALRRGEGLVAQRRRYARLLPLLAMLRDAEREMTVARLAHQGALPGPVSLYRNNAEQLAYKGQGDTPLV